MLRKDGVPTKEVAEEGRAQQGLHGGGLLTAFMGQSTAGAP